MDTNERLTTAPAAEPPSMYDISRLDAGPKSEAGIEVEIVNPRSGVKTGFVLQVKGALSHRFQELLSRQKQRQALRDRNPVARAVSRGDDDETPEVLAESTTGWWTIDPVTKERHPYMLQDGQQVPFSRKAAMSMYERYAVIRAQVLAASLEIANFIED